MLTCVLYLSSCLHGIWSMFDGSGDESYTTQCAETESIFHRWKLCCSWLPSISHYRLVQQVIATAHSKHRVVHEDFALNRLFLQMTKYNSYIKQWKLVTNAKELHLSRGPISMYPMLASAFLRSSFCPVAAYGQILPLSPRARNPRKPTQTSKTNKGKRERQGPSELTSLAH